MRLASLNEFANGPVGLILARVGRIHADFDERGTSGRGVRGVSESEAIGALARC